MQVVGAEPFVVHMYTEKQVVALRECIRYGSGMLYLDATGHSVKNVPDSGKKPFDYALDGVAPFAVAELSD